MPRNRFVSCAALLLCVACARADTGIGIQRLGMDVSFGVPPESESAPANFGPPSGAFTSDEEVPSFRIPGSKFRLPAGPPPLPCPEASATTFPEIEATQEIRGLPAEGIYRWKREGKQTLSSLPGVELPFIGFENRLIQRVRRVSGTVYTFQTVQPDIDQQLVVSHWRVDTSQASQSVDTPVQPVSAGGPERGLVLERIETFDAKGQQAAPPFAPVPAILYLPLPVLPGESWTSAGVDASTRRVFQHQGTVKGRERIDACGDVVDGWRVEGSQAFGGDNANSRAYNYIVATQLGAMLTSETVDGQSARGTLKATFSLGQLKPSTLRSGGPPQTVRHRPPPWIGGSPPEPPGGGR